MFYNSLFQSVFDFWIKLSKRNCSKNAEKGQWLCCEKRHKNIRGLGILPYGNLFRSVGRLNVKNFACVMTQAVLAMVVFDTPKGCVGVWKTIVLVQREQARLRIDKINSDDIKREIKIR